MEILIFLIVLFLGAIVFIPLVGIFGGFLLFFASLGKKEGGGN